jgi:NTE family protein
MEFGLALSGGGARGAAHAGVLRALKEEGLTPSFVAGTSAGAMVGALFAAGYAPEEIEGIFIENAQRVLDYNFRDFCSMIWGLATKTRVTFDGLIRGERLGRIFKGLLKEKGVVSIRDVRVPLAVTAVDINSGRLVMFVSRLPQALPGDKTVYIDDAELWRAVRASTAVPAVFKPETVAGMRLVDGGVRDNVPAAILRRMGAKKVLAVNLGYAGQQKKEVDNILEIMFQSIDVMSFRISETTAADADYVLLPGIFDVSLLEVDKIPETVRRGYEACMLQMPSIRRALETKTAPPPDSVCAVPCMKP